MKKALSQFSSRVKSVWGHCCDYLYHRVQDKCQRIICDETASIHGECHFQYLFLKAQCSHTSCDINRNKNIELYHFFNLIFYYSISFWDNNIIHIIISQSPYYFYHFPFLSPNSPTNRPYSLQAHSCFNN